DGREQEVGLGPGVPDLRSKSRTEPSLQRPDEGRPERVVLGVMHSVVHMSTGQVRYFRNELLWLVKVAHDLREYLHHLSSLGLHVRLGEQSRGLGVELEELVVEKAGGLHGDGLEAGPALPNESIGIRSHSPSPSLAAPISDP